MGAGITKKLLNSFKMKRQTTIWTIRVTPLPGQVKELVAADDDVDVNVGKRRGWNVAIFMVLGSETLKQKSLKMEKNNFSEINFSYQHFNFNFKTSEPFLMALFIISLSIAAGFGICLWFLKLPAPDWRQQLFSVTVSFHLVSIRIGIRPSGE